MIELRLMTSQSCVMLGRAARRVDYVFGRRNIWVTLKGFAADARQQS